MNLHENMIIASGEIVTPNIVSCQYNSQTNQYDIVFKNQKTYHYNARNISWLKNPITPDPRLLRIERNGRELFDVEKIFVFGSRNESYWRICFANGSERDYKGTDLTTRKSAFYSRRAKEVIDYLRCTAELCTLRAEDGTKLLPKQYEAIAGGDNFVEDNTALAVYLDPEGFQPRKNEAGPLIFPFGCNLSQCEAVKNAIENQISVIEGPPGTGKTQTILNIIANLLIRGKTVQVVSNNNSAISNVLEKLKKYDLDFVAALLGSSQNKREFIASLSENYPDFEGWNADNNSDFEANIRAELQRLNEAFVLQSEVARACREKKDIETEYLHFTNYLDETGQAQYNKLKIKRNLSSSRLMALMYQCQSMLNKNGKFSLWIKLRNYLLYGISDWESYKSEPQSIVSALQILFYRAKIKELGAKISESEKELKEIRSDELMSNCAKISMRWLRNTLYHRYFGKEKRPIFDETDLWKSPDVVLKEYPVVLSTTFSSRSSLGKNARFDYVIVDEASQVDVSTGALALSNALNAVIVGDSKQLPNVVTDAVTVASDKFFNAFNVPHGYNFAECSFLKSVCEIVENAPNTLLKEHYRCHPKIINFCNQKFYGGELVIMTEDKNEPNVLSAIRTAKGNHARGHLNQREIDVVLTEVLPNLNCTYDGIGVIAPYNEQVNAAKEQLTDKGIAVATVHKFQGREKEAIVMMTVDNQISEFVDNPYLLNVAVSRAQKQFCIVTSGNEQERNGNIKDLIDYIDYQNFTVIDSKVYSVFDYLYSQYTKERLAYLEKHKKVSELDSENLAYAMITDTLKELDKPELRVACHVPLRMIIRGLDTLNDGERKYVTRDGTHLDFLIYNRVSQKPILAIEVDGYTFHKRGTLQHERDMVKNTVLSKCKIPYIRFATNSSREKEQLAKKLSEIMIII